MKLLSKILCLSIAVLVISCEEDPSGSSNDDGSTLNDSHIEDGNGTFGNVDDYFYDIDEDPTPVVNSKFYRYSGLSIIEPLAFDADSDTLNFITVSDYVLSFSPSELITDMITLDPFDETIENEDINGDGQITGGEFTDLYRVEEVNFSHSFTDIIKLEWDEDNERYMVVSVPADASPLTHIYYIGHPDSLYNEEFPASPDTTDTYDSLVYITQINYNDLNGFSFTDTNENGLFDDTEEWLLDDLISNEYYFDQDEFVTNDSTYSSQNMEITHNFDFDKKSISLDSLMYKINTDCNDDGVWSEGEAVDTGNGVWDSAEPFLNQGGDDDTTYDIGEPFLDRNCNESWDDEEEYVDANENGVYDEGEDFTDSGNGMIDGDEVCADGTTSCSLEGLYSMSDRPNVLIASYSGNDWEVFENIDDETVVTPRWSETTYHPIETYPEQASKSKSVSLIDRVETIYSYQFIENTFEGQSDYSISKTIWYEVGERNTNYHLFRKHDTNGDIIQLVHDSYFVLPTTTPGSGIDGGSFENYIVFDAFPSEQTYLYTYNGLLRDGETHETSRQAYSSETNALYNIFETYEVNSDSLTIPELNNEYDDGEEYTDANENGAYDDGESFTDEFTFLNDVFRISRTKKSIMQGSGVELVELNNIWLAKDYGIVKDEMEFRFNEPDDFDGFYRLELVNCRHCDEESSSRAGIFNSSTEIDFNEFNLIGGSGDSYKKTRSFGLQKLEFNTQQ